VVGRAIALADAEGVDALTIRRLAQELGVTPMALYWHFRNKDELLNGLSDQFWSEIDTDVDDAAPWPDQLRALLDSLIQVLRTHPSASQLLVSGEKQSPAALEAIEVTLEVLSRGGFDPRRASAVARNGLWTGLMLAMSEPGYGPSLKEGERAEQHGEPVPAVHGAAVALPVLGRGCAADDRLQRPGLPLPVRHRPVHQGRPGHGGTGLDR
jgi:AcrR family transcriptional regulator